MFMYRRIWRTLPRLGLRSSSDVGLRDEDFSFSAVVRFDLEGKWEGFSQGNVLW